MIISEITVLAKKQKTAVISDIGDIKEFKKLLKSKTNVMILYVNEHKAEYQNIVEAFKNTADAMKGQASLVMIDCSTR